MHKYTDSQKTFIKENIKGKYISDLTKIFNTEFGTQLGTNQIKAYVKHHKFRSGVDCTFKKDQISFNKGKKKYWVGGERTQFKKGDRSHNYLQVGTERVNGNNYMDIKIADPNKWKGKHILIWEKHNGAIKKGHCIIFGDGNNRNFELDNLICVSRKQLGVLNSSGLIQKDAELTKIGIVIADIKMKMTENKRRT